MGLARYSEGHAILLGTVLISNIPIRLMETYHKGEWGFSSLSLVVFGNETSRRSTRKSPNSGTSQAPPVDT